MNFKEFILAAKVFENVLTINPMLANDGSILKNLQICQQASWSSNFNSDLLKGKYALGESNGNGKMINE